MEEEKKTEKKKKPTYKEILWDLYARGFGPSSPEAEATGIKYPTRISYRRWWEKEGKPGYIGYEVESASKEKTPSDLVVGKGGKRTTIIEAPSEVLHPKKPPMVIGHLTVPYEDWGYTSIAHMLVVASTWEEAKSRYGYTGPVGDFCADCVKLFRRIFKFDKLREEEIMEEAEHEGREVHGSSGQGDVGDVDKRGQEESES